MNISESTSVLKIWANAVIICGLLGNISSFTNEFKPSPCPNRCSYSLQEVVTIKCTENHTFTEISKDIKHLILEECRDDNLPNLSYNSSIQSVTFRNSKWKSQPKLLFHAFENVTCMKLEKVVFKFEYESSVFKELTNLEYLELEDTYIPFFPDFYGHLKGFQGNENFKSLIMSANAITGSKHASENLIGEVDANGVFIDIMAIMLPLNQTRISCLVLQNDNNVSIVPPSGKERDSLFKFYPHIEIIRLRNMTRIGWLSDIYFSQILQFKNLRVFESNNAFGMLISCSSLLHSCAGKRQSTIANKKSPSLEELNLQQTAIYTWLSSDDADCTNTCNYNIKRLDISYLIDRTREGNLFSNILHGFQSLLYLNMEGNDLGFLSLKFFHFVPKLETLLLSNSRLGKVIKNDTEGNLFANLKTLKHLDLSLNGIDVLPFSTFRGIKHLRLLNLTGNILTHFDVDLSSMINLKMIILRNNKIVTISSRTINMLTTLQQNHSDLVQRSLNLDLSGNNLKCECDNFNDIKWFQTTKIQFINRNSYTCRNWLGNHRVLSMDLDQFHGICFNLKPGQIAAIAISGTLFTIILAIFVYVYKHRHLLRYKIFRTYYFRNKSSSTKDYQFDAYVCYSSKDYEWVHNILRVNLEDKYGCKLCLDKRDFEVGNYITNNIMESIEQSRKTVLILSPNFVKSEWCSYEMIMANQKFLDQGNDIIVPVLFKQLEGKLTNNHVLKRIMTMKTYLEWKENGSEGQFWKMLRDALLK